MKDKEFEIPTNKESREEGSSQIVEKQFELRINKRLWKAKDLGTNNIDNEFISFI